MQVGKQLGIDEILKVIADQGAVVVDLAIRGLGRRPALPTVFRVEYVQVILALKLCHHGFFLFQRVEVFEKKQPGGLLGVVELAGTAGILVQDVIDILEGLFKHGGQLFREVPAGS